MAFETKWEKVDSNNIRKWIRETNLTKKQDLQDLKSDYNFISNMSNTILEKLNIGNPETTKEDAQIKVDELDAILDLYNNTTTQETIDFIDE